MLSDAIARALADEHRADLLRAAARNRLRRQGQAGVPRRVRFAVGRLLITAGSRVAGQGSPDHIPRLWPRPL
jgi:hypothetical protein